MFQIGYGIILIMDTSPETPSPDFSPSIENTSPEEIRKQRQMAITIGVVALLVIAIIIISLIFLLSPNTNAEYVARIRDVFIIIMAFESILIGAVLVILILQIARLSNLLQNEIKPILNTTNETVSTLRGTSLFLSENLTEPIITLNEYVAGLMRILEIFKLGSRKK